MLAFDRFMFMTRQVHVNYAPNEIYPAKKGYFINRSRQVEAELCQAVFSNYNGLLDVNLSTSTIDNN